ncbi:MAG: aspartate--tRNA ligase [Bacillota bacterium]
METQTIKAARSHNNEELSQQNIGEEVVICGWVQKRRDHGSLIFVDIRDRSGLVQVVFNSDISPQALKLADELRTEYVVKIKGKVRRRPEDNINPDLATGYIEIEGDEIDILAESDTPPFLIEDNAEVGEDLRLEYRYLDLRRPEMAQSIKIKHEIMQKTRRFLTDNGYWEVETPILTRSTPEGARDYLVPSRVNKGKFYALPQSPQLFKQLLMASGIEKYFQIARCFRDEDLRANRQPEFTQIDIELSFFEQEKFLSEMEQLIKEIFSIRDIDIELNFDRITYKEAMDRYGSDSPDARYDLELNNISEIFAESKFNVFKNVVKAGGTIRALKVPEGAEFSRGKIDQLEDKVKTFGAKGLAWFAFKEEDLKSPIAKFLSEDEINKLKDKLNVKSGDLVLVVAADFNTAVTSLGHLRSYLAKELDLISKDLYNFLWITDFPLFHYNKEEQRLESEHHPFTAPKAEDIHLLDDDPLQVRAEAYDMVLNGEEIGGGSRRIHNKELQQKIFNKLNLSDEAINEKFGFLIKAFSYGTPPHGGIAFGLDRIAMILTGKSSIRDVIAFPKNQKAGSLLTKAPNEVSQEQLDELGLKIKE